MTSEPRAPSQIGKSLDQLRRFYGLGSAGALERLNTAWAAVAGEELADRSCVIDLRDGRLSVDADDPATAEVLRWSTQRVLDNARELCPGESIVDLTVRVRRQRGRSAAEPDVTRW